MSQTAESVKSNKMPSSIPYIVGNEAAERFNYYGLRAILTTFMVAQFYNPTASTDPSVVQAAEATANAKTHDFVAMSYLLPMFGGMIADWFWGKYKTILYLSIVYAIGNVALALSTNNEPIFTTALLLIAIGAGGIKPCVSANVGDQFDESNSHLISKAFDAFYASINAGSVLSILLIPYLKDKFGPMVAFGVPAIAMCVAIGFFYAGRNKYRRVPPKGDNNKLIIFITAFVSLLASYLYWDTFPTFIKEAVKNNTSTTLTSLAPYLYPFWDIKSIGPIGTGPVLLTWAILILIIAFIFKKQWFATPGNFVGINLYALTNGGFTNAAQKYGSEAVEGIKSVWRVLSVFAFIPFFWALWDQSQSEWVVQATKMDLNFLGIEWKAEQISFVNAAFILLFIPIFSFWLYPTLERMGIKVTPLRKIGAGLFLTALSFVIIALIQERIDAGETPNIAWQIFAFVILTAGEVLISITGLEYAYTQSPPSMKSTIMACWLITVTLGNVLVSIIQNNIKSGGFFAQFHGAGFFWLFTGICAATGIVFALISPRIKEKSYIGGQPN
jgi:POT family proton-dependent oligopeptide transporter